jgi:DNA-binding XRE family transcriptional regulator
LTIPRTPNLVSTVPRDAADSTRFVAFDTNVTNRPPRPVDHTTAPKGVSVARVTVRAGLAAALEIRWARHEAELSQGALGKLAGVSQQQIAKLENPDENPSLETLSKVGRALGLVVNLGFERPDTMPSPSAHVRRRH